MKWATGVYFDHWVSYTLPLIINATSFHRSIDANSSFFLFKIPIFRFQGKTFYFLPKTLILDFSVFLFTDLSGNFHLIFVLITVISCSYTSNYCIWCKNLGFWVWIVWVLCNHRWRILGVPISGTRSSDLAQAIADLRIRAKPPSTNCKNHIRRFR